jgi:hypothetical protein
MVSGGQGWTYPHLIHRLRALDFVAAHCMLVELLHEFINTA